MFTKIKHVFSITLLTFMLASPVYAYSGTDNGGNGGLGGGMGTGVSNPGANEGISAKSYGPQSGTRALSNHDVSVYGTGTGSQFSNVNANSLGAANRTPNNQMQSYTDNGLRALETTSTKPIQWGWLGLLGLFGLFGARNRNSERSK